MMISKQQIAKELKKNLKSPYDPIKIAAWAEDMHSNHSLELSPEAYDIVETLASMALGEEFVYTEDEIKSIVEKLLKDEKDSFEEDPFQNIHGKSVV